MLVEHMSEKRGLAGSPINRPSLSISFRFVSDDPDDDYMAEDGPALPKIPAGTGLAIAGVRLGTEGAIVLGAGGYLLESLAE